jgi:hypothetical protein
MFSFLMLLLLRPGRLRGNGPGRHLHTLVLAARIVVGPSTWVWVRRREGWLRNYMAGNSDFSHGSG